MAVSRTVSRINSRQSAHCLAHQDRSVGVVLLHGGICAVQERPIEPAISVIPSFNKTNISKMNKRMGLTL